MNSAATHIKSKMLKTRLLQKDSTIREYVPETCVLAADSLESMLKKHKMVYLKPDAGRYGRGVMKVELNSDGNTTTISVHLHCVCREYGTIEDLWSFVHDKTSSETYLVQQGIDVLTYDGRPFDIRIMVQLTPWGQWMATGFLARVAAPQRIVTNFHSGGTPLDLMATLRPYLSRSESARCINRLRRLGERVALHCYRSYPGLREAGLDIAIDHNMNPWILEVNTRPQADVFGRLRDKTMYRCIRRIRFLHKRGIRTRKKRLAR